jgi:hypothetical protein
MIDRAEALYKYGIRYLQDEHTKRSLFFVKLILTVVKSSFTSELAREEGKLYLDKLREFPLMEVRQLHQVEIIPYETLWQMVIALLPRQVNYISA